MSPDQEGTQIIQEINWSLKISKKSKLLIYLQEPRSGLIRDQVPGSFSS